MARTAARTVSACVALAAAAVSLTPAAGRRALAAQPAPGYEYRVIATTKTSTMEKELNEAAESGFRFRSVMGGETAAGGNEVVAIAVRNAGRSSGRYAYKLLATSKTSTMEKELRDAAAAGYEYAEQTVFKSTFGGQEVVCILERGPEPPAQPPDYKLLATSRTSTLQKELQDAGAAGYQVMGMTVGTTAAGGRELVAILRRAGQ